MRTLKSEQNPFKALIYAQITAVSPQNNSIEVDFQDSSGRRKIQIQSPFGSVNSYRRSMPEKGSYVLLGFRASSYINPMIIKYLTNDEYRAILHGGQLEEDDGTISPFSKAKETESGIFPFRLLRLGEHEDISSGQASLFLSSRGRAELRGSTLLFSLDPDDLEIGMATPEFKIEGLDADPNAMQDVVRWGVVSRFLNEERWKNHIKHGDFFAKEYYMSLQWDGNSEALATVQTGICIDENGELITDGWTGELVRHREEYLTLTEELYSKYVDETGNEHTTIPQSASAGVVYDLRGENSSWEIIIGKDEIKKISQNQKVTINKDRTVNVNGVDSQKIGASQKITVGGEEYHKVGSFQVKSSGAVSIQGSTITLKT